MTMKVGIIGAGSIARCLQCRLENWGHEVIRVLRRSAYLPGGEKYEWEGRLEQLFAKSERLIPHVMFIAISTLDKGESARDYIIECVKAGVRVITCEKGALAYHATALEKYLDRRNFVPRTSYLKFSAAVTGGTQALTYLRSRHLNHRRTEVQTVINGTCNFVFDEVARGDRTLGEACQEASRIGYAEPGARDPLSLINGELRDVVMKTCVLFNTTLARENFITPDTLGPFQLGTEQLEELSARAANHRLVVSFSNRTGQKRHSFFNGNFEITLDGWHIQGGFRNTHDDAELLSWLPGGVGNAVHIVEGELGSGGQYTLTGPGAGHEPTTTAMLNDMLDE
jgi:homoserine dehydrogenase